MLVIFKWLTRAIIGLALLVGIVLATIYALVSRSIPDYSKVHRVTGLETPVEIVRTEHNIPHIFADSDNDVFFGLGFVHAQDRLWQMAVSRRYVQGRLSEIFGESTLQLDKLMRHLDLYGLANQSVNAQDEQTRQALKSYAAGVNAWINIVNNKALGRGSPEFLIFRSPIRPWTPADSLALLNLNAFDLSNHIKEEVLRQQMLQLMPIKRVNDLLPINSEGISFYSDNQVAGNIINKPELNSATDIAVLPGFSSVYGGKNGASNAWAIAPELSSTGNTILANDPHLDFSAPSTWMLARLELSNGGIIGATIPGIPLVILGRSNRHAWGLTSSNIDNQDLFFEKLDPDSSNRYLTPEGYKEFRSRISVINIKDQQPHSSKYYWTENGPVIDVNNYNLNTIVPDGYVVSLAWTLLSPNNTTMTGAMRIMLASNIEDALEAGRHIRAPALNFFFAENDNIAMQTVGSVPRRHIFHETKGQIPSFGWKYRNRWHGLLPYETLPRIQRPESGYLANANNRNVKTEFPHHLSYVWGDDLRISRIEQLLTGRQVHSIDSTIAAQLDNISIAARKIIPLLARNMWHTIESTETDKKQQMRSRALKLLQSWVGEMDQYQSEPLIYSAWLQAVQRLLTRDELGSLFADFQSPDPVLIERVFRNIDGANEWCDIVQTTESEDCDQISLMALDIALASLASKYGDNIDDWRWGVAHIAKHDHEILGNIPILSWIFNIRYPTSGGDSTINRTVSDWTGNEPFSSVNGAEFRAVYDFSNLDNSQFIIATGQSGHILSRHYEDLGTYWSRGEYIPMSLDSQLARSTSIGTVLLEPKL